MAEFNENATSNPQTQANLNFSPPSWSGDVEVWFHQMEKYWKILKSNRNTCSPKLLKYDSPQTLKEKKEKLWGVGHRLKPMKWFKDAIKGKVSEIYVVDNWEALDENHTSWGKDYQSGPVVGMITRSTPRLFPLGTSQICSVLESSTHSWFEWCDNKWVLKDQHWNPQKSHRQFYKENWGMCQWRAWNIWASVLNNENLLGALAHPMFDTIARKVAEASKMETLATNFLEKFQNTKWGKIPYSPIPHRQQQPKNIPKHTKTYKTDMGEFVNNV